MRIQEEHEISLRLLKDVFSDFSEQQDSTSLVVMVDDYSFPDPTFDYISFTEWLEKSGYKPDLVFRESQLIALCDEVIGIIEDGALRSQLVDYIKTKKYPCSLFIAAWYLLRLGKLKSPLFPESLTAKKLVNILPESFKPFEDKGLEIIKATKYADAANSIDYRFIEGRLIA